MNNKEFVTVMGECKPKVIIYGISHQAQQLKYLLEAENAADICAFVVDAEYNTTNEILGLPVYNFEGIEQFFPPDMYMIVLSFGYRNMVKNRQEKFMACKEKGYQLYTYISNKATVLTEQIGEGSLVYPMCFIAPFVSLGKGNFLENGTSIAHHTEIKDFCFFAPNTSICGDVKIESNCFFGSNCTVAGSAHIEERTLVAAGAVLLKSTRNGAICFAPRSYLTTKKEPEKYI